jgi:hypothetical protein
MDSALAPAPSALDIKTLLARIDQRITLLRSWLSHDHSDETYWWARRTTAPRAQRERDVLRQVANLLHVERATARGRVHGTRFATIDEQRTWLEQHAERMCPTAAEFAQLPSYATLTLLREGKLPL